MKRNSSRTISSLLAVTSAFFLLPSMAAAQNTSATQSSPRPPATADNDKNDTRMFNSLEDEMRAKREIQAADKAHKDNLNRARNLATLGSNLAHAYKIKSHLNREDLKTLEKAEKLAKGIREALGGSDDEMKMEDPPASLAVAIERISELSTALRDKVEKTPKRVVSAEVIDEANVLLQLIRIVRGMHPKT